MTYIGVVSSVVIVAPVPDEPLVGTVDLEPDCAGGAIQAEADTNARTNMMLQKYRTPCFIDMIISDLQGYYCICTHLRENTFIGMNIRDSL